MRSLERRKHLRGLARVLPSVFLLVACVCVAAAQQFEGLDLDGKLVDPIKAAAGKPVVLVFVRTDCPISNRYAPELRRLQAKYAGSASFWMVYPDKDETAAQVRRHMQEYGYRVPALRDPAHQLVKAVKAQATPEAVVFGPQGRVAYRGRIDDWYVSPGRARPAPTSHELQEALQAVTSGKSPRVASTVAIGCSIADLE